jgi:hypothetical protein
MTTTTHTPMVTIAAGRYPYRPSCSCGWTTWGYVADHAARAMAEAHAADPEGNGSSKVWVYKTLADL